MVGAILGMMICFDLGGPVNKMAMVIAALFLAPGASYLPLLNGVAAVCVAIPPMILV
jgi:PTS system fructose-specific IIC component